MKVKFWNFMEGSESRTLYLEGAISSETWYGDEVTPKMFKSELMNGSGDITVWINSPGGDVFAASQIYNMLKEYPGNVTVKIDGLAASAASVIAMAGSKVMMSPVSMLMAHNPMTMAFGDALEMEKAIAMLSEVKESIINAYELKTGLSRTKISHFMDAETWFNAKKAVELGFADEIMYEKDSPESHTIEGAVFSKMTVLNSLKEKFPEKEKEKKTAIVELDKRLSLLKY
ncbi:head maturation protease, ClpP-related [Youngiibacter multivorans]|uniref:ATP-dependent Clp protease proteolytic subunit n=1 Tax=Youngiibacter multivorans TaxID=937251 RepID=A0ABS4G707_9CLOT|nr:head maturation protease, ClpP-related [Youngiibacter multivorans]MBP1920316.1 ATP-dependent Clp protease protease subunit [Youngiibacter multivorans]